MIDDDGELVGFLESVMWFGSAGWALVAVVILLGIVIYETI